MSKILHQSPCPLFYLISSWCAMQHFACTNQRQWRPSIYQSYQQRWGRSLIFDLDLQDLCHWSRSFGLSRSLMVIFDLWSWSDTVWSWHKDHQFIILQHPSRWMKWAFWIFYIQNYPYTLNNNIRLISLVIAHLTYLVIYCVIFGNCSIFLRSWSWPCKWSR